jgi:nucleotide-binding universal stress UspA family protein
MGRGVRAALRIAPPARRGADLDQYARTAAAQARRNTVRSNAVIREILVGYDGSPSSERAFAFAADLSAANGARVLVVTVIDPDVGLTRPNALAFESDAEWAQNDLKALARTRPSLQTIATQVIGGRAADALLDCAHACSADLIVVGRGGKTAIARLLVGSVSRDLVAHADVPLVLVP